MRQDQTSYSVIADALAEEVADHVHLTHAGSYQEHVLTNCVDYQPPLCALVCCHRDEHRLNQLPVGELFVKVAVSVPRLSKIEILE